MKSDELIKVLHRLEVQTGSLACLGCGHEHGCSVHDCAIIRSAADMLEQQQNEIASLRQINSGLRHNIVQMMEDNNGKID